MHALPGSLLTARPGRSDVDGAVQPGGAVVLLFRRAAAPDGRTASPGSAPDQPIVAGDVPLAPHPPVAPASGRTCSCGHGKQAHKHYRRGTDCAMCSCARYARPGLRRLVVRRR